MALWRPRIKPGPPHRLRLNPQGRLSRGLWSAILFENAAQPAGMRDYADPTRQMFFEGGGEQPVSSSSPWGGTALRFATDDNQGYLGLEPATQATPTSITCSFLTKFDGASVAARTFDTTPFYDPFVGVNNFYVSTTNNRFTDNDAANFLSPAVTTFTTWTRLTITWDGTTASLYANGAFQSSVALALGFAPTRICGSWPWPMADFFFWFNRALSPEQVTAHYADPYGTTLQPRPRRLPIVGAANSSVAPAAGTVTITGFAPTAGRTEAPPAGALTVTGFAPGVISNSSGTPATAALIVTGRAPRLDQALVPGTTGAFTREFTNEFPVVTIGAVTFTGFAPPALTFDSAGRITITGFAPSLNLTVPPTVPGVEVAPPTVVPPTTIGDQDNFRFRLKAVLPGGWFPDTTPILDSVLSGCASAWASSYGLLSYVRLQTRIASATGVFLDLMAVDYFGGRLSRFQNESDSKLSHRIRASLLPERGTRAGVSAAVKALVGEAPVIFEPANTGDTGAWGGGNALVWRGMAYGKAGGWGSVSLPFQAFISANRARNSGVAFVNGYGGVAGGYGVGAIEWVTPDMFTGVVPDDVIFQTIADAAPAGSIMWTRLGGATPATWDNFTWDSGAVWQ